ncbi:flagellar biosynthetic protein FliR [Mangrovihabitans endophyticus]|uniref:Flagellar biosynthetic protein FliR n=1 Tax=Mangrovihabitans endophyticus TaxID=1751298 RepID=A0A8J3BW32_9ACTN|nr:flagellar biosynthetic protein FliR [Mangrovihabitans endophyticus]GGK82874.1 flagellar biosynthetic protein FliR [Mangrovihabitans endophyticus]
MNLDVPVADLIAVMLGAVRAGAWMMVSPPFQSRLIPPQVKALLSVGLALPMLPYLREGVPPTTTADLVASAALQVFVGAALGFVTLLFFSAVQAAGDLLDLFGGFTLATAYDPLSQNQSSVFGRFYNLMAVTLLFATEGHQLVLRGFLRTFRTLPLDASISLSTLTDLLTHGIADMFLAALQIAGPLIAVLFLTDAAFGLLNRVAPALNAFQLGFPAKIFLVLALVGTAITVLPGTVDNLVDRAVTAVVGLTSP